MRTDSLSGPISAIALVALVFCLLTSCGSKDAGDDPATSGSGIWARSLAAASSSSCFEKAARDPNGSIFAVGYINGSGSFSFGNASAWGTYASGFNACIVKYDASGTALWARSASAGSYNSYFTGVAVDSSGNAYAVGYIGENGTYTFGDFSIRGLCSAGANPFNAVIVKYDPEGRVIWAKTVDSATGGDGRSASHLADIKIDSSGNLYVAGWIYGTRTYTFGDRIVTGGYEGMNSFNALIAKFDSSGSALWARSVGAGASNYSEFSALAIDSSGDIYVAGSQYGNGTRTYGSLSVHESGAYASGRNALAAKYDPSGNALWAWTVSVGSNESSFDGIGVDSLGSVYAAGSQAGNGSFAYGDVTVTEAGACASGDNALIVKLDASSGDAVWARSASAASDLSSFFDIAVDAAGNAYAVGYKRGSSALTLGGSTVTGTATGSNYNALFAKYDSTGTVQWAQSVTSGSSYSYINGILADFSGCLFLAGEQKTDEEYTYGGVTAAGACASDMNAVLVKLAQ